MPSDLSGVYQQIAELTGRFYYNDILQKSQYDFEDYILLNTIDGLMSVWDEFCKGWIWQRFLLSDTNIMLEATCFTESGKRATVLDTGNFHADFARLLAAVLKECK